MKGMDAKERRRHVRMKPLPELPAAAKLTVGAISEVIAVQDISVGGMALGTEGALRGRKAGEKLSLQLALGAHAGYAITAEVRYVGQGTIGFEFVDLTPEAATAIRKYVAELLERGAMS